MFFVGLFCGLLLGLEISLVLFVDVLNVDGVLSSLVIDLQCFLSGIIDKYCLQFASSILCYFVVLQSCSVVHLVSFSLVCLMGIALPDVLWVARVLQQLSLGDGIWLFPILVWFIADQSVMLFRRRMVSHIAVKLSVMLYEFPRW